MLQSIPVFGVRRRGKTRISVACATRPASLPVASWAGNDRNADTRQIPDFMHGLKTSRHEGTVRTIPTESLVSIASDMVGFKQMPTTDRDASREWPVSTGFSA
jgi:hypothetical protein